MNHPCFSETLVVATVLPCVTPLSLMGRIVYVILYIRVFAHPTPTANLSPYTRIDDRYSL